MKEFVLKIKNIINDYIVDCKVESSINSSYIFFNITYSKRFDCYDKPDLATELYKVSKEYNHYFLKRFSKTVFGEPVLTLCFKNLKRVAVKVPEKIYHLSPINNRESIISDGLKAKDFFSSKWKEVLNFYYEPAVFCSKSKDGAKFLLTGPCDTWEINTKKLKNEWFYDCNMLDKEIKLQSVMTYENIKPSALKLLEKA